MSTSEDDSLSDWLAELGEELEEAWAAMTGSMSMEKMRSSRPSKKFVDMGR